MADGIQKRFKLPRNISAIIVIFLFVGVVGGILTGVVWKIVDELKQIYENFPIIYVKIQNSWLQFSGKFDDIIKTMPQNVQDSVNGLYDQFMDWIAKVVANAKFLETAGDFAKKLPSILISIITFILSLYFMVSDSKNIDEMIKKHIPKSVQQRASLLKTEIKKYLGGYLKAQLVLMCISFLIILIGFLILRVEYALILALAIAIFDALPFFGSGAVLIPSALVNFVSGNISKGIGCLIIYLSVLLMRQLIEPKIVGKNIGMHPLLTLMSMYAGYRIFSIGGLILGPLVITIIISFYKVGIFDGIIKFVKTVFLKIKKEIINIQKSFYDEGE